MKKKEERKVIPFVKANSEPYQIRDHFGTLSMCTKLWKLVCTGMSRRANSYFFSSQIHSCINYKRSNRPTIVLIPMKHSATKL